MYYHIFSPLSTRLTIIHCTELDTIDKYLQRLILDKNGLKKVNSLRLLAGNLEMEAQKTA